MQGIYLWGEVHTPDKNPPGVLSRPLEGACGMPGQDLVKIPPGVRIRLLSVVPRLLLPARFFSLQKYKTDKYPGCGLKNRFRTGCLKRLRPGLRGT